MKNLLKKILKKSLSFSYLNILNNSYLHLLQKKNSHYKITIVSERFNNLSLLKRHIMLHKILSKNNVRIYSIDLFTYTKKEWNFKSKNEKFNILCIRKREKIQNI